MVDGPFKNSHPEDYRRNLRLWHILLVEIFIIMFLFILFHPQDINEDCSLNLLGGQMILEGKLPYVDFIEYNPPLIFYINTIPVLIAQLTSLNTIFTFLLFILVIVITSTILIKRIIESLISNFNKENSGILCVAWALFSLLLLISGEFGEREHIFLVLYFPFFIMRWIRWRDGNIRVFLAVTVGFSASIGACLKPHFILIVLVVELYWIISKKSLHKLVTTEFIAFTGIGTMYALHFFFVPTIMREAYLNWLLPMVANGYHAYNRSLQSIILNPKIILCFVATLLPFLGRRSEKNGIKSLGKPLSVFTLAAIIIHFIQNKGYNYHAIPAYWGAYIIFILIILQIKPYILDYIDRVSIKSVLGLPFLILISFIIYLYIVTNQYPLKVRYYHVIPLAIGTALTGKFIHLHFKPFYNRVKQLTVQQSYSSVMVKTFVIFLFLPGYITIVLHMSPSIFHPLLQLAILLVFLLMIFWDIRKYIPSKVHNIWKRTYILIPHCIVFLIVINMIANWNFGKDYIPSFLKKNKSIVQTIKTYSKIEDPIMFISTSLNPFYPAIVQLKRRPASRYLFAFPIAMLYKNVTAGERGLFPYHNMNNAPANEIRFLKELNQDLKKFRPVLIFIHGQNSCYGCPEKFNIMEYLKTVGFIKKLKKNYKFLSFVEGYYIFVPIQSN